MTLETKSLGWWKFIPNPPARLTPHTAPTLRLCINTAPANGGGETRCGPQQPPCSPHTLPGAVQPPQPSPASPLRVRGPGRVGCSSNGSWRLPWWLCS